MHTVHVTLQPKLYASYTALESGGVFCTATIISEVHS
jgi:hypothetical protein